MITSPIDIAADSLAANTTDTLAASSSNPLAATGADTLAGAAGGDSLRFEAAAAWFHSLSQKADSLLMGPAPESVAPEQVFGEGSSLVAAPHPLREPTPVYESGLFQGIVLALALIYLFVICRNLQESCDLLRKLSLSPSKSARMTEIQGSSNIRFLWTMTVIGLPTLALVLLRLTDQALPLPTLMPPQWIPVSGILVVLTIAAIALFQVGLLWIVGHITLSQQTVRLLTNLKFNYFSLASLILCPLALLYILTPSEAGRIVLYVTIGVMGIILLLFLKDTLMLFLSKKISILHWILYLCGVEIFPLNLIGFWMAKI